jgi:hypothetical protein
MAMAGRVVAILSAMLVPTFLLLPFIEASALTRSETGWALFSGADIIVTLAALATMLLVAASFSTADSPLYGAATWAWARSCSATCSPRRSTGLG